MKKALSILMSLILVLATLPLSAVESFAATTYTVTFIKDKATGEVYEVQTVNANSCAVRPADPTMNNYTFLGWRNGNQTDEFDFSTPITADTTLYAGWTPGIWADVPYIDENGISALCPQKPYETITSTSSVTMTYQGNWNKGWYVVEGNVTLDYLSSRDNTNLILKDGATLTVNKRISVEGTLNIFGQSAGSGSIVCPRINDNSSAPTVSIAAASVMTVNGGNISAVGIPYHAAIGSAQQRSMGTLIVNAGTVTATGGNYASAIGAGYNGNGGNIIINGGTVNATAGNYGNALGGYYNGNCEIVINGGKITAAGGTGSSAIKATSLTLGWTNASDYINIGGPLTAGSLTVSDDFVFESDSTLLVTESNIVADKLIPYTGSIYSVRFLDSDGVTEIAPSERFASGGTLTNLPTAEKYGYRFVEWRYNSNTFAAPSVITQNIDLIAYFEQITPVSYVDENGVTQICYDYTEIDVASGGGTTYGAGWYVLTGDSSFTGRLVFNGSVNLILADGLTLNAQKGITVGNGNTFTVYGQSNQTGALTVGTPDNNCSGIGGVQNANGGTIVINGGVITSTGGRNASAIGGGGYSGCENVIINNGTVNATGGQFGSGIGGGAYNSRGDSNVTVNGGTVNVNGGPYAAGIGYGYTSSRTGTVTINGGTVTSTAGNASSAIGGGQNADGGTININGGNIRALTVQSNSFGMGAGNGRTSSTINFNWSNTSDSVYAVSYNASDCNFIKAFKVENTSAVVNTFDEIKNKTIVPFTDTYYTVEFLDLDGITALSKPLFIEQGGTAIQPEIPVKKGYRFSGWTLNNALFDFSTAVSGNVQLIASWQQAQPVDYIDENGETQTCDDYGFIESTSKGLSLSSGWYVIDGNITVSGRITVSGTVNIIIKDGADSSSAGSMLTASKGIAVNRGNTLNIYAQSYSTGTLTTGTPDASSAGIGGGYGNGGGTITINGGCINARGGNQAAGIGSGYVGSSGVTCDAVITVNAGTVTSVGGNNGAGIGSGQIYYSTNNTTVNINGGRVIATGGNQSAGIGGGYNTSCGTVNINGGYIEARGGTTGNGIGGNGEGTISLSWTGLSDRIYASSYNADNIYILKAFRTDNPDEPATVSNINGKTLIPFCLQYDIDEDGVEDINDICFIISASVGNIAMTVSQAERADFDSDGVVDAFDAAELDRILFGNDAGKGDVDQDGDLDLVDYAMIEAHISGVDSDENHPANLLDKSYLPAVYDNVKDNYDNDVIITQQYYCADYDSDKAVDAFDLFCLDKRLNNIA